MGLIARQIIAHKKLAPIKVACLAKNGAAVFAIEPPMTMIQTEVVAIVLQKKVQIIVLTTMRMAVISVIN